MTLHAHDFDADTALEALPDGRLRAWAPEHWFVARGPNGGFLAAVAARAAEQASGRPLRSLTLHFVARRRSARSTSPPCSSATGAPTARSRSGSRRRAGR
jgi:hypothetical protein